MYMGVYVYRGCVGIWGCTYIGGVYVYGCVRI